MYVMAFDSARSTTMYSEDATDDGIQPEPDPKRARQGSPPTLNDEAWMSESGMRPLAIPSGSAHSGSLQLISEYCNIELLWR